MTDQRQQTLPALLTMQARPQWICWHKELRRGTTDKYTKVPYDPRTGHEAKPNDPTTWGSYTEAYTALQQFPDRYDGLGYMFSQDLVGVDLDHCLNAHGGMEVWARAMVKRLASYTEYSPSGTGVHILLRGTVPKGIRRFISKALPQLHPQHPEAAIEMYCQGRYFTVTGKHVEGTPTTLENTQDALDALYEEVVGKGTPSPLMMQQASPSGTLTQTILVPDDETLLKKAEQASNGAKFASLFYKGSAGYPSASEADLALCLMLAFWTGRDPERMDRLFRRSALYREKWDTARSTNTYGQDTIQKAAALCRVVYDPERNRKQVEQDIDRVLSQVAHQQEKLSTKRRKLYQITPKEIPTGKVLHYLEENEYGDARFFAEAFAGQVCYDHKDGTWYLWHGHHWKEDATGKILQLVSGVLGNLYLKAEADLNTEYVALGLQLQSAQGQGAPEPDGIDALSKRYKILGAQITEVHSRVKALRSAKRNANVLRFIASELGITSDMWDTDPWLLAVPNGVLDLHTGTCRDGVPEDYIRTVAPTEWTGLETPCPRFEHFLEEIFEDRADQAELIAFVHRLLGYGITGLTTIHIFPILYGSEGRNGKDTLVATLKAVLGALVGAVSNDVFLAQDKARAAGAASPHLVDLQGKRLVWGSETKEGDRLNVSQIKHLTGGGDVPARQLHGHQYAFSPTHKLLLMTNYKPHADARDKPFWSRACLIEFGMRFVDQPHAPNERNVDLSLKETLKEERSGILAWLVRGCLTWQEQGLNMPESVRMATTKYQEEEDKTLLFLQECCVITPDAYVKAGAFFKAYRDWYETNQFGGRGMNGKLFGDEMKKRFERKETEKGRIYRGVGLLTNEPEPEPLFPEHGGSMEGHAPTAIPHEGTSQANRENIERLENGGYGGLSHVFPENEKEAPSIGGKYGLTLHTLHSPSPVIINKPATEASAEGTNTPCTPSIDPPSTTGAHFCTTRWIKRKKVAHEAVATRLSAGCWWCEECDVQRTWMEYGEAHNYPSIDVQTRQGFHVRAGRESWLRFAQEAGRVLVGHALEAAQKRESFLL